MNTEPLVSIGMPVYNGERLIGQALESLLGQDYKNFELIISDNASTDQTPEVCKKYMSKDGRIRYYRNERNLGIVKNFNRVFNLSEGKYFMWAGDHDMWHPNFVSRLVSILEGNPEVVLAYPRTILIDVDGHPLMTLSDRIDTRNMPAVQRYKKVVRLTGWGNMVYGLMRRDALARTGNYKNLGLADKVFISELSMLGTIAQIDEPLFYRRRNRPPEARDLARRSMLYRMDPSNATSRLKCSIWYLYLESYGAFLKGVFGFPIGFREKMELSVFLTRYIAGFYVEEIRWLINRQKPS